MLPVVALLTGCFWVSPAPNFADGDRPEKIVVIWDARISENTLQRSTWLTTDETALTELTALLPTNSWQSSSVLPAGHATRIILTMASGTVWEIVQSSGKRKGFSLFDRGDHGRTGRIDWSGAFIDKLSNLIETDRKTNVDLTTERRKEIMTGRVTKVIAPATKRALAAYPGYPEIVWDPDTKKFEYAK